VEVGIREFRNNMGEHLRRGEACEVVTPTERGRPIACLVPVEQSAQEQRVWNLVAGGKARWRGRKLRRRASGRCRSRYLVSALVAEERDESSYLPDEPRNGSCL
jgi:prevent-host-death family protein